MHPKLVEVAKNLGHARATYAHACTQAKSAIRAVVGDGTGDPGPLADAQDLAKEFGFTLDVAQATDAPTATKARAKK